MKNKGLMSVFDFSAQQECKCALCVSGGRQQQHNSSNGTFDFTLVGLPLTTTEAVQESAV